MSDEQPNEEHLAAIHEEAVENKKLHLSEQWFYLYRYVEGEVGPVKNTKTNEMEIGWVIPPKWERVDETLHTHHPDSFHPDVSVRISRQREMLKSGVALTACGEEQDPRLRFIEEHDEANRCSACIAALSAAKEEHDRATKAILEGGIAELRQRLTEVEALPQVVPPEAIPPEAVDAALAETLVAETEPPAKLDDLGPL